MNRSDSNSLRLTRPKQPRQRRKAAPRPVANTQPVRVVRQPAAPKQASSRSVELVCGISDPFCPAASGAKYPDSASARTLAMPFHTRAAFSTNGTGYYSTMVVPGYEYISFTASSVAGTNTYVGSTVAGPTLTPEAFRIVTMGVRIRNICSLFTASGMVRVRGFGAKVGTNLATTDAWNYNCDFFYDIPLKDCTEIVVILKRLDISSQDFVPPATCQPANTLASWVSPGWGCVQIGVDGAPISTPVIDIEYFVNYELTFPDSDTMSLATTPPRPPNLAVQTASTTVMNRVGQVFERGARAAATTIAAAASRAIEGAVRARLGPLVNGMAAITVD